MSDSSAAPLCPWRKLKENVVGTPPHERAHHTTVISDTNKLIIFGGDDSWEHVLNDLVVFDFERNCWDKTSVNKKLVNKNKKLQIIDTFKNLVHFHASQEFSSPPTGRSFHTAVFARPNMIIMGGFPYHMECEMFFLEVSFGTWTWTKYVMDASVPEEVRRPRSHHSAAMWGDKMVVYGGIQYSTMLDDLLIFDTTKFKWRVVKSDAEAICSHSSFVKDDNLFIVGGFKKKGPNDFMVISLTDGKQLVSSSFVPNIVFASRNLATVYDEAIQRLYIFGGFSVDSDGEELGCTNKVTIVDLNTKTYGFVPYSISNGDYPKPRCGHTMNLYKGNLIVFGGCNRLPLLNGEWIFCNFSNSIWEFTPPNPNQPLSDFLKIENP